MSSDDGTGRRAALAEEKESEAAQQQQRLQGSLLPTGLYDLLPPTARQEAAISEKLLELFGTFGYQRVKPPLIEFEDSLLSGLGAMTADRSFRLLDPVSRRMMAVCSDMTVQVDRIAGVRLKKAPRPLRLSYGGEVLRVSGSLLSAERQFRQVGVELIGSASAAADSELILLAATALDAVGIANLSIDLMMPPLVEALLDAHAIGSATRKELRAALDGKDVARVESLGRRAAPDAGLTDTLLALLNASGTAEGALARMAALDLPAAAAAAADRLRQVVHRVRQALPTLALTIDPVENRGFEYHSGLSMSFFSRGVRGELGRGGRYRSSEQEDAAGFTCYMDTVLRALPLPEAMDSVFVPFGAPPAVGQELRKSGWTTIAGLAPAEDPVAEARRLGCSHCLVAGRPVPVEPRREP